MYPQKTGLKFAYLKTAFRREAIYLEGGVQFITSRILLVDLLTSRIPVNHVAGILVWRAHQLVLRIYHQFI